MAVASTSGRQNIGAHSGNSAYFDKKGEVNELRQLLRSVAVQNNIVKARDAVKKTIAYMTLGIDVSRLFSDMIMLCHSRDPVLKKMIYLYLTNYAEYQSDLAILAVNTLQKDCREYCHHNFLLKYLNLQTEVSLIPIQVHLNDYG